ncbi:MAG: ATP-binding protein [Afipia sp.]|nr:ATP-binding protein [Afipia sp.]
MVGVFRKTEIEPIDGTPVKRMFWSIISDYNLETALAELIDNALDVWLRNGSIGIPKIELMLDADRQLITVTDNAGGVGHEDLKLLVAPGGSKNDPNAERIGIFGVGSKRAGIALGEQVEIRTRREQERSLELDITKEWLESDDWELAAYEIPEIPPSTTRIDISRLRRPFAKTDIGNDLPP